MRASYIFDIYKCYNIVDPNSNIVDMTDFTNVEEASQGGPTTFVEVTFAGISVRNISSLTNRTLKSFLT